ncbi:MAG: ATP-dependent helicase [Deltaproteobacteria bacterium]|nr:ATP-dependent helicase [Deltaproteobacteria bacterium]
MADKIVKFIGPPGTGKTHTLLQQIAIDADRYGPKAVGAVSLTRAALHEIRLRISKELNIHHDDIPHIQTMHSHCFRLLQLSRDKVADTPKWVREFNQFEGGQWKITEGNAGADLEDVLIAGTETFGVDTTTFNNDILRSMANLHRQQLIPQDKWHTRILEWFNAWKRFMRETDLIDYTGMMEKVYERGWTLPIKVLHIDEGQDLSPLAHALAQQFGEVCSTVSWYGDSNQSIYRFAGAMPESFMDLPHTERVILDQSYRCSPSIVNYANSVISKCQRWEQAEYKPCMSYGEGKRYFLSEPDLSLPGTHMILSRAKYQVEPWIAWLIANGIPYYNPYRKDALMWNPCDTQIFRALRTHQALAAGEDVPLGDFLIMLKHTQAKYCFNARGGKKDADTMAKEAIAQKRLTLSLIDMDQMSFNPAFLEGQKGQGGWQSTQDFFLIKENNASELLKQMIARDTLTEQPRVIVGTQHSIKGGSADYVWIDPAWPGRVRQNVIGKAGTQDYDDEVRLAYVATTRARRGVGIVHPKRGFDDGCIY